MENYDPQFALRTHAGDVIVGGFNFGTGSSREQAVTCLKAKGIPLIIAASFSQTYLRNAYNNGFLCIEVPALFKRLREQFASEIAAKEKTIIPGEKLEIDFTTCTSHVARGELHPFRRSATSRNRWSSLAEPRTLSQRNWDCDRKAPPSRDCCRFRRLINHGETYRNHDARGRNRQPGSSRGFADSQARSSSMPNTSMPTSVGTCWCSEGNALPQRTVDLLAKHKLGLFGAITSKPKKQAEAELSS